MPNGPWFISRPFCPRPKVIRTRVRCRTQVKAICFRGGEMAIVAHVVLSGLTEEDYDRVREAAGWLAGGSSRRRNFAPDVLGRRRLPQRGRLGKR